MAKKLSNVTDIQLDINSKQQFRINGDDNRIIELDVGDLGVLNRLRESYPRLQELGIKGYEADDSDDDSTTLGNLMNSLNAIDAEMCSVMDYIFDSKIAKICADGKPLYNMRAGKFVFEIILDTLFGLYSDNIQAEFGKMSERMQLHTNKYTGKK